MIKNEAEYQTTQEWVDKFKKYLVALEADQISKRNDPQKWQQNKDTFHAHLYQLQAEITEYERLINCKPFQPIKIKIEGLARLPDALIKARIAAKISQKELANLLGIDEQRVKQYEETDYQGASFVEILEVSAALGVELETAVARVDFKA